MRDAVFPTKVVRNGAMAVKHQKVSTVYRSIWNHPLALSVPVRCGFYAEGLHAPVGVEVVLLVHVDCIVFTACRLLFLFHGRRRSIFPFFLFLKSPNARASVAQLTIRKRITLRHVLAAFACVPTLAMTKTDVQGV